MPTASALLPPCEQQGCLKNTNKNNLLKKQAFQVWQTWKVFTKQMLAHLWDKYDFIQIVRKLPKFLKVLNATKCQAQFNRIWCSGKLRLPLHMVATAAAAPPPPHPYSARRGTPAHYPPDSPTSRTNGPAR